MDDTAVTAAALAAVRRLHSATELLLDAIAERYRISRTDLRCLEIIERSGSQTAGELARASGLSPAAITKVLRRLEAAGYAVVTTPADDRRRQVAAAAPLHQELRRGLWDPVRSSVAGVLAGLDQDELRRLSAVLADLADVSEQQAGAIRAAAGASDTATTDVRTGDASQPPARPEHGPRPGRSRPGRS